MTKHPFVVLGYGVLAVAISTAGCGNKKDPSKDHSGTAAPAGNGSPSAMATPATPTEPPPSAAPASAAEPSGATVDLSHLAGAWTKDDNHNIVWTFKDGGTMHIKTSAMDYDASYQLDGTTLTVTAKDLPTKKYTVQAASASKLSLDDPDYHVVSTFSR